MLALTAKADEIEILLISLTYGNVEIPKCLKNVLALFNIIDLELDYRKKHDLPIGFETLLKSPPIVACGADKPLETELIIASYYRM